MNRQGHADTNFFVGTEVEASPVAGHRTLFVVGLQTASDIDWKRGEIDARSKLPITHIYFGANQSFPALDINDGEAWRDWEFMIQTCMDLGFLCSLDLDVAQAEGLLESGIVEDHLFIPMISVKLPYIRQFGYNATLKLDDRDFAATNPGVWCHSLHALQRRSVFTDWSEYTQDEVIK